MHEVCIVCWRKTLINSAPLPSPWFDGYPILRSFCWLRGGSGFPVSAWLALASFCFTYFLHGRVRLFIFLSAYLSICPSIHSFIHKIPKCLSKKTQNHAMTASHACGQRKPLMSSLHIISCMNLLRCLSLCTSDGHSSFRRQTFAFTEYVIFHTTWNFLLPFTVLAPVKGHHCCCIKSQFLIAGL